MNTKVEFICRVCKEPGVAEIEGTLDQEFFDRFHGMMTHNYCHPDYRPPQKQQEIAWSPYNDE